MSTTPIAHDAPLEQRLASALSLSLRGSEAADADSRRRYGLTIGGQRFLIDQRHAVHVVSVPSVYRLPNTRRWFLGLVNLRGSLVPVYDLAACFGIERAPQDRRMMMVLGDGDAAAASVIDGPPRHVLVGENQEQAQVPQLDNRLKAHARLAYRLADGVWVEVDWNALFVSLRTAALTDLAHPTR